MGSEGKSNNGRGGFKGEVIWGETIFTKIFPFCEARKGMNEED